MHKPSQSRPAFSMGARRDLVILLQAILSAVVLSAATSVDEQLVAWFDRTPVLRADALVAHVAAVGLIVFATKRWVEERRAASALRQALSEIDTLTGLIPICSSCKRVRAESDYWLAVEQYVASHSGAEFSHALCPACAAREWAAFESSLVEPDAERERP